MVDKELIAEIKNSVNIVEVIGEVVSLTKAGRNFWASVLFMVKRLLPFNVVEDKQFYHCFGCGRSGDVFKFIEDYRGVALYGCGPDRSRQGWHWLQYQARPAQPASVNPNQELYEIHQEASKFYQAILMTTKMGKKRDTICMNVV